MDINKINKVLDTTKYHVFYKTTELKTLANKKMIDVKKAIKEQINPPKKDKIISIVDLKFNPNDEEKKIIIVCVKFILSKKLNITADNAVTVIYSKKELEKYKFKKEHIEKIVQLIKDDKVDYQKQFINVSEILNTK